MSVSKGNTPDEVIDRCDAAYRTEYGFWRVVRRGGGPGDYQLIRQPRCDLAPSVEFASDTVEMSIVRCSGARTYEEAGVWLEIFRGRAAMRAALEALSYA